MKAILFIIFLSLAGCANQEKPTWEYAIQSVEDVSFKQSMDTLGSQGWELVFARRASDGSTYSPKFNYEVILKRQKYH